MLVVFKGGELLVHVNLLFGDLAQEEVVDIWSRDATIYSVATVLLSD